MTGPTDTADRLPPGLTTAAFAVLAAASAAGVVAAAALALESGRFDPAAVRSAPTLTGAVGGASAPLTAWSLTAAAASILTVAWMYRAARAVRRRRPEGATWSPGWAIGGWFLPFANLVIPKLVVNQVDRVSNPGLGPGPVGERWRSQPLLAAGHWWWALLVVSTIVLVSGLGIVAEQLDSISLAEPTYRAGLRTAAVGCALHGAASAAGSVVVRTIGRRFEAGSPEPMW